MTAFRRGVRAPGGAAAPTDEASGDLEAFADLYDRHAGRVYALARHLCATQDHAELLTRDVFLAVWQRPERADRPGASVDWLLVLTRALAARTRRGDRSA